MRGRILLIVTAALLALPGAPTAAAPADRAEPDAAGCSGSWTDNDQCTFRYGGGDLNVSMGLFAMPAGAGIVTLEMKGPKRGTRIVLLECESAGQFAGCAAGQSGEGVSHPEVGDKLFCVVKGSAEQGHYACATGT